MNLDAYLVLARHFLSKLRASSFHELREWQRAEDEEKDTGDQTAFYGWAMTRATPDLKERLPLYDLNLREYEERLAYRRQNEFKGFRYFQYLTLLAMEYHLDRLTRDPEAYLKELNEFRAPDLRPLQFTLADLRHLAFYLATGAGKTLLLHVHYWQIGHYLKTGPHKEALPSELAFGNILLLAPNAGLAEQHLRELERSGIPARRLTEVKRDASGVLPNTVLVVDMPKLRDKRAKDEGEAEGLYYPDLGQANLVFADEGHKGTASLDRGWRQIREWLSERGMLLEYSATFAQVLKSGDLLEEYGKRILADYRYRYFYQDQYGKDFRYIQANPGQLNPTAEEEAALMGGLLLYYLQLKHYRDMDPEVLKEYNLHKPLWTFVGHTVLKRDKTRGSEVVEEDAGTLADVAKVVRFFKRVTEEPRWAQDLMLKAISSPKFIGDANPFAPYLTGLQVWVKEVPHELYLDVLETVFLGRGALELHLMPTPGEIGLKVSGAPEYFGVINIGDTMNFRRQLEEALGLVVGENPLYGTSLFQQIHDRNSPIQVLVGSRKFVEGWSSWRVSTMTLLNIGKNQGPLILQLFGRGVRLLGKNQSLKRSGDPRVQPLETLYVLGLNADYVQRFLETIRSEEVNLERIQLKLQINRSALAKPLPLPQLPRDFSFEGRTLVFEPDAAIMPRVTLAARVSVREGERVGSQIAGKPQPLQPKHLAMLDWVALRQKLLIYARAERIGNLSFSTSALQEILRKGWYSLVASEEDLANPKAVEQAVLSILRKYLSEYYRRRLNDAQAMEMRPGALVEEDLETHYEVSLPAGSDLLSQIQELAKNLNLWYSEQPTPIPRLFLDPGLNLEALYQPLVYRTGDNPLPRGVEVRPTPLEESEYEFIRCLRTFWQAHYAKPPYAFIRLYLMRNAARKGLGFHHKTGFYPDFILWVEEVRTRGWRVVFVEPHGMAREPIENHPKLEVFTYLLPRLNARREFQQARIVLDGYILAATEAARIPGNEKYNPDWDRMAEETHLLVRERGCEANMRTVILGRIRP